VDIIHLNTDLPSSYPARLKGNLTLAFEVERGEGEEYLKKHFEFATSVWGNIVYLDGDK
jgi:hypothetical protein